MAPKDIEYAEQSYKTASSHDNQHSPSKINSIIFRLIQGEEPNGHYEIEASFSGEIRNFGATFMNQDGYQDAIFDKADGGADGVIDLKGHRLFDAGFRYGDTLELEELFIIDNDLNTYVYHKK